MEQMTLFDFLPVESESLVHAGDTVFQVVKAEIFPMEVLDESWTINTTEKKVRCWKLKNKDGGYGVLNETQLSNSFFLKEDEAINKVQEYLKTHDVIFARDLGITDLEAYSYVRDVDQRTMYAYIGTMKNGLLYVKEFVTYVHAVENTKKNKKAFEESIREFGAEKVDFFPELKNLYACKDDSVWKYAEAKYKH